MADSAPRSSSEMNSEQAISWWSDQFRPPKYSDCAGCIGRSGAACLVNRVLSTNFNAPMQTIAAFADCHNSCFGGNLIGSFPAARNASDLGSGPLDSTDSATNRSPSRLALHRMPFPEWREFPLRLWRAAKGINYGEFRRSAQFDRDRSSRPEIVRSRYARRDRESIASRCPPAMADGIAAQVAATRTGRPQGAGRQGSGRPRAHQAIAGAHRLMTPSAH